MFSAQPLRIWLALLLAYLLAALAAAYAAGEVREFMAFAAFPPFVIASLLHRMSIPGMLQHDGKCGWGWCEPTPLGWIAGVAFIAGALWMLAAVFSWLRTRVLQ